jgi:DNA-binding transcriptional regulator YhcF (GntR family)
MSLRHDDLVQLLRRRLLEALRDGSLTRGDRLGSTRALSAELGVNLRAIMTAYQTLAGEGLVDVRPRSGIYVAAAPHGRGELSVAAERWLSDVLADGVGRHLPIPDVAAWAERATRSARVRAAVVGATVDIVEGLRTELQLDFGIDAYPVSLADLERGDAVERLRDADVVVSMTRNAGVVRPLAERAGVPFLGMSPVDELVGAEWRSLLRGPVYIVMTDPDFERAVRDLLGGIEGVNRIRYLVVGRDDLDRIPADAAVYATRSARAQLAGQPLPGRSVPTARMVPEAEARALAKIVVRKNLAAWRQAQTSRASADLPQHATVA